MPLGQSEKTMARVALELQPCCRIRSGIGTYTYELACRLYEEDGLEFQGNIFNFLGRNVNSRSLDGIPMPVVECKLFPYGVYRRIWNGIKIPYDRLFPHSDLTLFFDYIVPPDIGGLVITTIHDLTPFRFPHTMKSGNRRRINEGLCRSIERSKCVIAVSEFTKREIISEFGVSEEKIAVIPNAPCCSEKYVEFAQLEKKYRIHAPYILFFGTIEPRKNLTKLLKAYEHLKTEAGIPHKLVLAGGPGWNNEEIYSTAKGLSCANDVIFTGFVSAEEKNTLYKNAAAFVYPSIYEGFGIPPLEAMHFGCPVITSDAASLPEVVGDAARLINPYDETSIAEGIFSVINNNEYARHLIRKGYQQEKKYTWDASAEKLKLLCKEVLKGT